MIKLNVDEFKDRFAYTYGRASKRAIAHDFFKFITTEAQAYLLGLIASDGSISTLNYSLCHKASDIDAEEIIPMYQLISPDARIERIKEQVSSKPVRGRYITAKPHFRLTIQSKSIIESLKIFGFGDRKTYDELHLPKINKDLIKHFIRGILMETEVLVII